MSSSVKVMLVSTPRLVGGLGLELPGAARVRCEDDGSDQAGAGSRELPAGGFCL